MIKKRSVTINRHRSSISLEDAFWDAFREIAAERAMGINALVTEIDANRDPNYGLASAIRVYVLEYFQMKSQ